MYDVVLTAYNFRQPHAAEVEKAIDEAAKAGLGIIAMKTQAGVFWDRERQHPINMKAALKYGYRNLAAAKETFELAGMTDLPCAGCGECPVECPMGFDVKKRIGDIARIQNVADDFIV